MHRRLLRVGAAASALFSSLPVLADGPPGTPSGPTVPDPNNAEARSSAEPDSPPAAETSPSDLTTQSVSELMAAARQLNEQLEFDRVLPVVREVLSRQGVSIEVQLDAYVLEGSCLAIIGNPIDAEGPFRRLLRGRPDFELPAETPPKIISVFRKVQAEERAIADQMEALTRKRIVERMSLRGDVPQALQGGRPLALDFILQDPSAAARSVRVQYRRQGDGAYSSLALSNDGSGRWRGAIPGEWTANDHGAQVELFVEAVDQKGPLLTRGSAAEPILRSISPGQVDLSGPPPLPPWSVWVGVGATAAIAAAGLGFGVGVSATQQAYDEQVNLARSEPQPGSELRSKREQGEALSLAANGLFVASGVAGLATAVAGLFFTDWEGRSEEKAQASLSAQAPAAR